MKKLNLSVFILMLAVSLTAPVSAEVVVNGTPISEVVLNGQAVNNLSIVQSGSTLTISTASEPNACADPQSASCPGSAAFCVASPTNVACPGSTAFCSANPAHVSCPGSQQFCAVAANINHPSCVVSTCPAGMTVFETIKWTNLAPGKTTVTTGASGVSSKILTTASRTYKGSFQGVADTLSGSLTRRMWFSECPGGAPIVRAYSSRGVTMNACDVSGPEPKILWSQEVNPLSVTQCKLEPSKQYYLNHTQSKFGSGPSPTATSKFYRGHSSSGTP